MKNAYRILLALLFSLGIAGCTYADQILLNWREDSGNWRGRTLTTTPGYVLSFDSLGRPIIAAPAASGDFVVGPASSVSGTIPLFNGTTGKLVQGSIYTPAYLLSRANHSGSLPDGVVPLPSGRIGYGGIGGTMTSEAAFYYDPTFNAFYVGAIGVGQSFAIDTFAAGILRLAAGSGQFEDIMLDLSSTANTGVLTSGSGLTLLDFPSIALSGPLNTYNSTTWNGSRKFATEDAVRDKIETLSAGLAIGAFTGTASYPAGTRYVGTVGAAATATVSLTSGQMVAFNVRATTADRILTLAGATIYRVGYTYTPVTSLTLKQDVVHKVELYHNGTFVELTDSVADDVALGTDTSGNYIATLTDSGAGELTFTGSGEGATMTAAIASSIARDVEVAAAYQPLDGDLTALATNGHRVAYGAAASDETTAITTGTGKVTFRLPHAMTLTAVRASVTTAPTGATILIDINEGGTTVLSTKMMIDATEKTSTTATTAYVISDAALADDAEITIDFDQVGSTVAGAGVKVWLIGTR